jgi:hypothetical protein
MVFCLSCINNPPTMVASCLFCLGLPARNKGSSCGALRISAGVIGHAPNSPGMPGDRPADIGDSGRSRPTHSARLRQLRFHQPSVIDLQTGAPALYGARTAQCPSPQGMAAALRQCGRAGRARAIQAGVAGVPLVVQSGIPAVTAVSESRRRRLTTPAEYLAGPLNQVYHHRVPFVER